MGSKAGPVLVLYNTPSGASTKGKPIAFGESEAGILEEVRAVCAALERIGVPYNALGFKDITELPASLYRYPAKVAFNLIEGFQQDPTDMTLVPAICRSFGIEVTGSDTACTALLLDKWKTKAVLAAHGILCPAGVIVPVGKKVARESLPKGRLIVKPASADASEGIDSHSIVDSDDSRLDALIQQVHKSFGQPALVEEMVGSRELNVAMLQVGNEVQILPLAEIDFGAFADDQPKIVGYSAKWKPESFEFNNTPRIIPAPVTPEQAAKIEKTCRLVWDVLGCRDYVRVDLRLNDNLEPVILEVNPNPDITPGDGFASALQAAAYSYEEFVQILIDNAAERLPASTPPAALERKRVSRAKTAQFHIRYMTDADRRAVLDLLTQPTFFTPEELAIAQELVDDSIKQGAGGDYQSFVLEDQAGVVGWACFGPTPCTTHTFDLYWLAIAQGRQKEGIGRALVDFVEDRMRERGGKISVVETSGRDDYAPTRIFYERTGYLETARVPDFYSPGDDKIISAKHL